MHLFSWYVPHSTLVAALNWKLRTHFVVSLNQGKEYQNKMRLVNIRDKFYRCFDQKKSKDESVRFSSVLKTLSSVLRTTRVKW